MASCTTITLHAMSEAFGIIKFLEICEKLKTTKRTGWVERRVAGPESISDHMHRMGIIAMLLPESETMDKNK